MKFFRRLASEPPFRLFFREILRHLPISARTAARWETVTRPWYLLGLLAAANRALKEHQPEFSAIEFGVAGGNGLLKLQEYARRVERECRVQIHVYGFDTGHGIPTPSDDYRDHPDLWVEGDYPLDEPALRKKLDGRTELWLGNVAETVPQFIQSQQCPIGFIAVDLDLYTSTVDALRVLADDKRNILRRTFLYFDDVVGPHYHRFAGELRAIDEFNQSQCGVLIDRWRGIADELVFHESSWAEKMFVAHDVRSISKFRLSRTANRTRLMMHQE